MAQRQVRGPIKVRSVKKKEKDQYIQEKEEINDEKILEEISPVSLKMSILNFWYPKVFDFEFLSPFNKS